MGVQFCNWEQVDPGLVFPAEVQQLSFLFQWVMFHWCLGQNVPVTCSRSLGGMMSKDNDGAYMLYLCLLPKILYL